MTENVVAGVWSRRRTWGVDTTMSVKAADEATVREMVLGFETSGGKSLWLVDATVVKSYRAGAITVAASEFGRLMRERGLVKLVAVIQAATVRMAASVVAMTMRAAGAPLDITIVSTRAEAEALMEKESTAPRG
jgi:hypothetical protein